MPGRSSLASALKTRSPECSEVCLLRDNSDGKNIAPKLFHSRNVTSDLAPHLKFVQNCPSKGSNKQFFEN
jgi:hypothetical protein